MVNEEHYKLGWAAAEHAMNEGIRHVQDKLGVKVGDFAAHWFYDKSSRTAVLAKVFADYAAAEAEEAAKNIIPVLAPLTYVRIHNVDLFALQGREPHPTKALEGKGGWVVHAWVDTMRDGDSHIAGATHDTRNGDFLMYKVMLHGGQVFDFAHYEVQDLGLSREAGLSAALEGEDSFAASLSKQLCGVVT